MAELRKVEGLQCTNCDAFITDVVAKVHFEVNVDAEDYLDGGVSQDGIMGLAEEALVFECPQCGDEIEVR